MKANQKGLHNMSKKSEVLVYDVPEAGRLLGLNRNKAYAAAASGEIPTIRFGRLLKVPKAALDRLLNVANELPRRRVGID